MISPPRRILITGATGFVGRHLIRALASAFPGATLLTPTFDLTNFHEISSAIREAAPETCIHLAAISTPAKAALDEELAWRVNLHGTLHLAHAILRHAPDCQLIFASSADAYGASFLPGTKVDEATPLAPLNLYTATKAAADLALGSLVGQNLRLVRLRPFNHTGPGQHPGLVIAAFGRQIALIMAGRQDPVVHVGNLETWRDFLDVRDVCAAYAACIARCDDLKPGAIFNLASGIPRQIGDILETLKNLAGIVAETRVDETRIRHTDVPLAVGEAVRAREALGWTASTPWRQTLRDVLDDWRGRVAAEPDMGVR
jgi:GDP-4-dehydro-6-deoxy-D-mannose reductase